MEDIAAVKKALTIDQLRVALNARELNDEIFTTTVLSWIENDCAEDLPYLLDAGQRAGLKEIEVGQQLNFLALAVDVEADAFVQNGRPAPNLRLVGPLLDRGYDPTASWAPGKSAVDIARRYALPELLLLLRHRGIVV